MKFPRILRVQSLFLVTIGIAAGIALSAAFPKIPENVKEWIKGGPRPPHKRPPTLQQINQVLSDSRALVEAQHTYYVHVTRNTKFAESIRELGSSASADGTVMVNEVWKASDAVASPISVHGYLFKSLPVAIGQDKKDGFVVAAYPADKQADAKEWPIFLSIVPDATGGIIGMTSRDTWEIEDAAASSKIRDIIQRGKIALGDLEKFSPLNFPDSFLIENFKKEIK